MNTTKRLIGCGLGTLALCAMLVGTGLVHPSVAHARLSVSGLLSLICGTETESSCASLLDGSVVDWLGEIEQEQVDMGGGIAGYEKKVQTSTNTLSPGGSITLQVNCTPGKWIIGGGGKVDSPSKLVMYTNAPEQAGGQSWRVSWVNSGTTNLSAIVTVYAICVDLSNP